MNDLQLDYFMAVANNLSFTKTAEELFVSQPAISRQISQLEKELDVKLFVRNNQKTVLTEEGRLYFDLFSRFKSEFINTKMDADKIAGKYKGLIRVGFLEGWDLFEIIPKMNDRYKAIYPDSDIVINCCGVKELASGLLTDSLDIVVTMKNSITSYRDFESEDIAKIGKVLIYSAKHPLASKTESTLSLNDFRNDTFFAPWEIVDKMIVETISEYTRPYGFIPNVRFVKNHESTITCVRNNMGVAIVDEWVWAKDADDIKWFSFDAHDTVSIARLSGKKNENVLEMEAILKEVISNMGS